MQTLEYIDSAMCDAWLAGGAAASYSDDHLRVMVAWLRGMRDYRPLREHEETMLAGYLMEIERRRAARIDAA